MRKLAVQELSLQLLLYQEWHRGTSNGSWKEQPLRWEENRRMGMGKPGKVFQGRRRLMVSNAADEGWELAVGAAAWRPLVT